METNNQGETPTPKEQSVMDTPETPVSPNASRDELVAENTQLKARIKELNNESRDHRLARKTAEQRVVELQQQVEGYTALGTPDELQTRLTTAESRAAQADELERLQQINQAATVAGYNAEVLAELATLKRFGIKLVDGEGGKAAVATFTEGDVEKEKPLAEYVEGTLSAYLPALRPEVPAVRGTVFVKQVNGDQQPVALTMEQLKERKMATSSYPTF